MVSKKLAIAVVAVLIVSGAAAVVYAGGFLDDDDDGSPSLDLGYLKYTSAQIEGSSGLGLGSEETSASSSTSGLVKAMAPSDASDGTVGERNFLYTQGATDGGLHKVVFKRTVESEEKVVGPDGKEIPMWSEVRQEELPAQVHKVLVWGKFTFIQFVPTNLSDYHINNPNEIGMTIWTKDYSTCVEVGEIQNKLCDAYPSNALSTCFVMDNETGRMYLLDDSITVQNGLIRANRDYSFNYGNSLDRSLIYDLEVLPSGGLHIFPLFANPELQVSGACKDRFGNNYVFYDGDEKFDESTHTKFVKDSIDNYLLASDHTLIQKDGHGYHEMDEKFEEVQIGSDDTFSCCSHLNRYWESGSDLPTLWIDQGLIIYESSKVARLSGQSLSVQSDSSYAILGKDVALKLDTDGNLFAYRLNVESVRTLLGSEPPGSSNTYVDFDDIWVKTSETPLVEHVCGQDVWNGHYSYYYDLHPNGDTLEAYGITSVVDTLDSHHEEQYTVRVATVDGQDTAVAEKVGERNVQGTYDSIVIQPFNF